MARRGYLIPQEFQANEDQDREMVVAKLRRTVEQLQRRLQQYEGRGPPRRQINDEEKDYNPFQNEDVSSDEANQLERMFDFKEYLEQRKVKFEAIKLRDMHLYGGRI
ncbi:hypothetical protein QYF36_018851 [Acer negundo]|nr:hypothetical protein QYF36_018851 [Acer negundo]